jgi:hypothetical protein
MALNPPVLRHREWRFLLRDFVGAHSALQAASSKALQFGLAPVASVARWLLNEQPGLLEKESLTLLIPGASGIECSDDGRWFAFLPWMLGRPGLSVQVHLVGTELNFSLGRPGFSLSGQTHATSAATLVQRYPKAKLFEGTLGKWRTSSAAVAVDACILFSPGFSAHHRTWFAPGELSDFLAAGPLGLFSYSKMDALEDQAVLRMLGFKFEARELATNPWVLEHAHLEAVGCFGRYPWSLQNVEVPAKVTHDSAELKEFTELQELLCVDAEEWGPDEALRRLSTPIAVSNEAVTDEVYLMPGGLGVLKSSGLVGSLDDLGFMELAPPLHIPPGVLAARPNGDELDCAMWALRVYRDHLEPLVQDEDDEEGGADSVLDAMLGGLDGSMEDMLKNLAKRATGKDFDGHDLMNQIRISGGIHGPTHPCWFDMLETLGWEPDEYLDEPERLEPAFWVAGERHAKTGLPVVCEGYAYFPDDEGDELANAAMKELGELYPEGALLGFKSMPYKEIDGHKYTFGGLLYWEGAWHPFAMTTAMTSVDSVIDQIRSGFSFEKVDPKYADDNVMLAVPFNRMCFGLDPNESGRMMGLTQATGWVTLMPA